MNSFLKNPLVWLLVGTVPVGLATFTLINNPTNSAKTQANHPGPRLRTRQYTTSMRLPDMRHLVEKIIPTLSTYGRSWKLVADRENSSLDSTVVRAEVPVFFFTDDLQVQIRRGADNTVLLVDVQSASRVGKSDLGENRRHILKFLAALDEKMGE